MDIIKKTWIHKFIYSLTVMLLLGLTTLYQPAQAQEDPQKQKN